MLSINELFSRSFEKDVIEKPLGTNTEDSIKKWIGRGQSSNILSNIHFTRQLIEDIENFRINVMPRRFPSYIELFDKHFNRFKNTVNLLNGK